MNWYKLSQLSKEQLIHQIKQISEEIYGGKIHQDRLKMFYNMTEQELLDQLKFLEEERPKELFRKQQREKEQQRQSEALFGEYQKVYEPWTRVVCDTKNPQFEKLGMPAYEANVADYDHQLKGYYGVHVGNDEEWLPVMKRDEYCNGDAYVYNILCDESPEPFYIMDDYHISNNEENLSGWIIFSKYKVIPANLIKLIEIIPEKKIRQARDMFPEQNYP